MNSRECPWPFSDIARQFLVGLASVAAMLLVGCGTANSVDGPTSGRLDGMSDIDANGSPTGEVASDQIVSEDVSSEEHFTNKTANGKESRSDVTFYVKGMGDRLNLF